MVELTPVVPSFRRKRRKINSPIYLGIISGKSKRSDCDEDNVDNKGEVRDEVVVVKEMMMKESRVGQIHAECGLPDADLQLKMIWNIRNEMRGSRCQGHLISNLSKGSAGISKLDSSDGVESFEIISAALPASMARAFEEDNDGSDHLHADTTALQGDSSSLKRATSKIHCHDVIHSSSSNTSLTSSRGCSRKKDESGRKGEKKKYDDAYKDAGVIDQRIVTGIDKKASISSRKGTISSDQLKRSSRLMLKSASIPLQPALLQLSVDTTSSTSFGKVSRIIRPSLTNNTATLSVDNTEDHPVLLDLQHSYLPSREHDTYACDAIPFYETYSSSGCIVGAPVRYNPKDTGQHTAVIQGPPCDLSPPKISDEGHVSVTATADGSHCTRSSNATASPLQSVMKRHPSTSRSRKLSSLSLASVSALNSHVTSGPSTSNMTRWVDPYLIEEGRLGVKGRGTAMEGEGLVKNLPKRSLAPPSRASVSHRFSRSASAPSAFSSTSCAEELSVRPNPSLPLSPSRDYRHSSFRARKMLEAAKEIVVRNNNEQH